MSNVRFYKLGTLPSFVNSKHVGIFVHATGTTAGSDTYSMTTGLTFNQWLTNNHYTEIPSGLWFGGENGWELLTNDTSSGAIDAAIDVKIQALDVEGYAQATISTTDTETEKSSTLTIKGIKEVDGKINEDKNFDVAIDGVYNKSSNKIATQDTVNNKIATLDANAFQTVTKSENGVNTVLTFNGIKEVDGIISQGVTENAETFTVGNANLKIQIGSNENEAFEVFSANAQSDSTIKLNEYVFRKDDNNVISVITPTAVASDNRLVTEKDVANLAGAMHYKGTISSLQEFQNKLTDSDAEEAGDVYIATGSFTHNNNVIENGDMIVFNSASEYTVVQSNLTLGTKSAQIAKNDGDLKAGNIVVATADGIMTSKTITEDTFSGDNNKRDLTYGNGTADGSLYHDVTISDSLTVLGKDLGETINISSTNRSIEIAKKTVGGVDTGVMVDLVWNTNIE